MEESKAQELEKDREIDPETTKTEESEEKPKATRVLALDMILKSLWKISVFLSAFLVDFCQETHHILTEDEEYSVPPLRQLRDFLLMNLNLTHPLEENVVHDLLVAILDLLPHWRSGNKEEEEEEETLNSQFYVYEKAKKNCNRCKLDTDYPVECCYGLFVDANSLRETKSVFKDLSFENILKVIRISLKMDCDKEGCEKKNYVQRMITKLPSVFTIALGWENNETEGEIFDTTSVLATEIDVSAMYLYEGDSAFTKYRLVSMVCLHGDQYNCVAYEKNQWVRYFGNDEEEVIGDWNSVISVFATRNIRPTILFFENVMGRGQIMGSDQVMASEQIVFGTFGQGSKDK